MSSKTKIVVLHMKEIIYTAVFAVFAIILILLLLVMFLPKAKETSEKIHKYQPGVYNSDLTLGNTALTVEVTVNESEITSIRFANLDETVTASYPLIQPAIEEIAQQIIDTQSLENISYSEENPYTAQVIINAIQEALKKAAAD
ncbi:MAG: hypothetical protein HFH12_07810 [Dorea sp.]|nr:hypothetical protein [Dorea sp.]